jgi:hypothetical protein
VETCTFCKCELTGGMDTYGPLDKPRCQSCHLEWCEYWWEESFSPRRQVPPLNDVSIADEVAALDDLGRLQR